MKEEVSQVKCDKVLSNITFQHLYDIIVWGCPLKGNFGGKDGGWKGVKIYSKLGHVSCGRAEVKKKENNTNVFHGGFLLHF